MKIDCLSLLRSWQRRSILSILVAAAAVMAGTGARDARAFNLLPSTYGILWHNTAGGWFSVWEVKDDGTVFSSYLLTSPGSPYNGGYFYCGEYPADPSGCSRTLSFKNTELIPQRSSGFDFLSYDAVGGHMSLQLSTASGSVTTPGYVLDASCGTGCSNTWKMVGTGTFDTSGLPSLLWYDATDRLLGAWQISPYDLRTVLGYPTWSACGGGSCAGYGEPVAAADFNGDGISDVLWLTSDGSLTVFLENGVHGSQLVTLSRPAPFLSSLVGARRLTYGPVLVWYNQITGVVQEWIVSATGQVTRLTNLSVTCGDGCSPDWQPVGLVPLG